MTKDLYIFTGLGGDERIFQHLDFSGFSVTFIKWIVPYKDQNIQDYASQLLHQIKSERPILIGLSFGGLMAVEIAKQIKTEKVILIASAKTRSEIPFYYRLAGWIGVHKWIPVQIYKQPHLLHRWVFRAKLTPERKLVQQILQETNPIFLKWAIDKIVTWENQTIVENIFHIHGSHDKLLPKRFIKSNVTIQNGGHLITLSKADDLNRILRNAL